MKLYYNPEANNLDSQKDVHEDEHVLQGHDIRVETKKQHEKMKDKPFKEKASYFFYYYKFHVLAVLVGVIAIYSIAHAIINSKDYSFTAMIINSTNIEQEVTSTLFSDYAGLDQEKYYCYIDANESERNASTMVADPSVGTKFAAMISNSDLDVVICDSKEFYNKAVSNIFLDLTTVLTEEQLNKYKDKLYYIDGADLTRAETDETIFAEALSIKETKDELLKNLKMHQDPSTMSEPILIGIVIDDSPFVKDIDSFPTRIPVLGIAVNSQRIDTAVAFLSFVFDENIDFTQARLM